MDHRQAFLKDFSDAPGLAPVLDDVLDEIWPGVKRLLRSPSEASTTSETPTSDGEDDDDEDTGADNTPAEQEVTYDVDETNRDRERNKVRIPKERDSLGSPARGRSFLRQSLGYDIDERFSISGLAKSRLISREPSLISYLGRAA